MIIGEIANIGLCIDTSGAFGRGILRGIRDYARPRKPWRFFFVSSIEEELKQEWLAWKPRGIIVFSPTAGREAVRHIQAAKIPFVVAGNVVGYRGPRVGIDNTLLGHQAAQYFIERGFRNFATVGHSSIGAPYGRCTSYAGALEKAGFKCAHFDQPLLPRLKTYRTLTAWLAQLKRPVAVLCVNDETAFMLSEVCFGAGIRIPDEVALLGVDNDEVLCDLSHPTLSSIQLPTDRVGYEAAAMLDQLISGEPLSDEPRLLPPGAIVTRQSSEVLAIEDRDLVAALRFIRNNAHQGIGVADVLREVAVSRRSLERKFKEILDRSPLHEIKRIQIDRARELLSASTLSIEAVAGAVGFQSHDRFGIIFKQSTGMTPRDYRKQHSTVKRG